MCVFVVRRRVFRSSFLIFNSTQKQLATSSSPYSYPLLSRGFNLSIPINKPDFNIITHFAKLSDHREATATRSSDEELSFINYSSPTTTHHKYYKNINYLHYISPNSSLVNDTNLATNSSAASGVYLLKSPRQRPSLKLPVSLSLLSSSSSSAVSPPSTSSSIMMYHPATASTTTSVNTTSFGHDASHLMHSYPMKG